MRLSSLLVGSVGASRITCAGAASSLSTFASNVRSFSTLLSSSRTHSARTRFAASAPPSSSLAASSASSTSILTSAVASSSSSCTTSILSSSSFLSLTSIRHTQSATAFRNKKQKEWRLRQSKGFADLKTHAGCKKRFRFVSRWAIVCKHNGKYHKNYHKRASRLRRLRAMKVVPRHLVKRLKIMMPYWRNQLRREEQYQRIHAEESIKGTSALSYQRQQAFIEAQQQRLHEQLLKPKAWFPTQTAMGQKRLHE